MHNTCMQSKMARGEEAYQGKLLESRDKDFKDEVVLAILNAAHNNWCWPGGLVSDDPAAMTKINLFFEHFKALPYMVYFNLWILVCASIFGIKGTQIFRNGGKK